MNRFFEGEHQGYLSGAFYGKTIIQFSSTDPNKIEGQLIFPSGVIKEFSGTLNENELKFKVNRFVQGEDKTGLGTVYILRIGELLPSTRRIEGTYQHVDNRTGEVFFNL